MYKFLTFHMYVCVSTIQLLAAPHLQMNHKRSSEETADCGYICLAERNGLARRLLITLCNIFFWFCYWVAMTVIFLDTVLTNECKIVCIMCNIWSTRWVPNGYRYLPGMGTGEVSYPWAWVWVKFSTHQLYGYGYGIALPCPYPTHCHP
jgi:hypothetical protein